MSEKSRTTNVNINPQGSITAESVWGFKHDLLKVVLPENLKSMASVTSDARLAAWGYTRESVNGGVARFQENRNTLDLSPIGEVNMMSSYAEAVVTYAWNICWTGGLAWDPQSHVKLKSTPDVGLRGEVKYIKKMAPNFVLPLPFSSFERATGQEWATAVFVKPDLSYAIILGWVSISEAKLCGRKMSWLPGGLGVPLNQLRTPLNPPEGVLRACLPDRELV